MAIGPPDRNFDHGNFYYRFENAGPFRADIYSSNSIGWTDMGAVGGSYVGMVARIVEGTGRGQERLITGNSDTTLNLASKWLLLPDSTSQFVVADGSWKFAAVSATSPAKFEIAYRRGAAIQISGRAANVNNQECEADLCPLTRWPLGGGRADIGLTAAPDFTLSAPGSGLLVLSQVGFRDLTNTSSVASGTLQLFAWNELLLPGTYTLLSALDDSQDTLQFAQFTDFAAGQVLEIDAELLTVVLPKGPDESYTVQRGSFRSTVTSHPAGVWVLPLVRETMVLPFAHGFFANRASQNYLHTMSLPDQRICAAAFYTTNSFGDGFTSEVNYVSATQSGLRTLSGGQMSLQVSGYLATQQTAAPPMLIQASHAVRDIRAAMSQGPVGFGLTIDLLQNDALYCRLLIDSGKTQSTSIVNGVTLAPLLEGASLNLNVSLTPVQGFQGAASPGQDLTVTIRF